MTVHSRLCLSTENQLGIIKNQLCEYFISEHLGKKLDEYVTRLSVPVHVIRLKERTGLIRARLLGE